MCVTLVAACKADPTPQKEGVATATTATGTAAAPEAPGVTTATPAAPKPVPTWGLEPFATRDGPAVVSVIDNAIVLLRQRHVGKVNGGSVEWIEGKFPKSGGRQSTFFHIAEVAGRWPDRVDFIYRDDVGRGTTNVYSPLTGQADPYTISNATNGGWLLGFTTIGESTVVVTHSGGGQAITTVRGPKLTRSAQERSQVGCPPLPHRPNENPPSPALPAMVATSSRAGTLVTAGSLCNTKGLHLEVWDGEGKSTLLDLQPWFKTETWPRLLRGAGDQVFIVSRSDRVVVQLEHGKITPLPEVPGPLDHAFTSLEGKLYITDGSTISRLEAGAWTKVAMLQWPLRDASLPHVTDDMTFYVNSAGVQKLVPAPSLAYSDDCATPFVYLHDVNLYDAKGNDTTKSTFPATREALKKLPGAGQLELLDVHEATRRRLGISVKSKEQGESIIVQMKASIPAESPMLLCYAPKSARRIPVMSKEKR